MPVVVTVRDRVAEIVLDRPEALNALDTTMRVGLRDAWTRVRDDEDIWAAIVTGAGERAFCVGADLKESRPSGPYAAEAFGQAGDAHLLAAMAFDKPIICAINGLALAGGMELALGCDIRIAAAHATMGLPEVRVASVPGGGGSQTLPRAVGMSNAMYLLLTGDTIDATEALRMGLISQSVAAEQLMDRAREIADRIVRNAPLSVRATKRLTADALGEPLSSGLAKERYVWGLLRDTADRAEGRQAFRERRDPQYRGC